MRQTLQEQLLNLANLEAGSIIRDLEAGTLRYLACTIVEQRIETLPELLNHLCRQYLQADKERWDWDAKNEKLTKENERLKQQLRSIRGIAEGAETAGPRRYSESLEHVHS